jgi:hypothetical protein
MFDPYEGCAEDDDEEAKRWLYQTLHLEEEAEEDWALINRDARRTQEFLDFYLQHPQLSCWRRHHLADLVVASLTDLVESDANEEWVEQQPTITDEEAVATLRRMVRDPMLMYYLEMLLRPDMAGRFERTRTLARRALALEPSVISATTWLEQMLGLKPIEPNWLEANRDGLRAHEFLEFYYAHPELKGWRLYHLRPLVAESIVEHIQRSSPNVATEGSAAMTYEKAEALLREVARDAALRSSLSSIRDDLWSKWVTKRTRLLLERVLADEPPQSPPE